MSNRMIFLMAILLSSLFSSQAQTSDESCIDCHLHSELTKDFAAHANEVKTLAGFHGQAFKEKGSDASCQACHESRQTTGMLPSRKVCLGCHTRGKSAQGDPDAVFHAEEKHWPMDKVSCTTCHKGHTTGNRVIKFLTTEAINACQQCHKKSFKTVKGPAKTDSLMPTKESDNRYGQTRQEVIDNEFY